MAFWYTIPIPTGYYYGQKIYYDYNNKNLVNGCPLYTVYPIQKLLIAAKKNASI